MQTYFDAQCRWSPIKNNASSASQKPSQNMCLVTPIENKEACVNSLVERFKPIQKLQYMIKPIAERSCQNANRILRSLQYLIHSALKTWCVIPDLLHNWEESKMNSQMDRPCYNLGNQWLKCVYFISLREIWSDYCYAPKMLFAPQTFSIEQKRKHNTLETLDFQESNNYLVQWPEHW